MKKMGKSSGMVIKLYCLKYHYFIVFYVAIQRKRQSDAMSSRGTWKKIISKFYFFTVNLTIKCQVRVTF